MGCPVRFVKAGKRRGGTRMPPLNAAATSGQVVAVLGIDKGIGGSPVSMWRGAADWPVVVDWSFGCRAIFLRRDDAALAKGRGGRYLQSSHAPFEPKAAIVWPCPTWFVGGHRQGPADGLWARVSGRHGQRGGRTLVVRYER
jgi:hypothetical protein